MCVFLFVMLQSTLIIFFRDDHCNRKDSIYMCVDRYRAVSVDKLNFLQLLIAVSLVSVSYTACWLNLMCAQKSKDVLSE